MPRQIAGLLSGRELMVALERAWKGFAATHPKEAQEAKERLRQASEDLHRQLRLTPEQRDRICRSAA